MVAEEWHDMAIAGHLVGLRRRLFQLTTRNAFIVVSVPEFGQLFDGDIFGRVLALSN